MWRRSWGDTNTQPKVDIVENPAENVSSPESKKDIGLCNILNGPH